MILEFYDYLRGCFFQIFKFLFVQMTLASYNNVVSKLIIYQN